MYSILYSRGMPRLGWRHLSTHRHTPASEQVLQAEEEMLCHLPQTGITLTWSVSLIRHHHLTHSILEHTRLPSSNLFKDTF